MLEKQYQLDKEAHRANFIDEYLRVGEMLDKRIAMADKQLENYKLVRNNIDNIFSASGAADCKTLEGVFASKVEAEKLTFSIGEKLNDGRERFTFSNSCDMIK